MISRMKKFRRVSLLLFAIAAFTLTISSCNKKDYPCPGLGKSNEADLSMFDEGGQLKSDKDNGRIDKKTGMVKKKKPKRLQNKRKTHL